MLIRTWQAFDSQVKSNCHVGMDILPAGKMDRQANRSSPEWPNPRIWAEIVVEERV
jgi:hypothetical protein